MQKRLISLVVSVYNEESVLPQFYQEALARTAELSWDYELIFVNDGSTDGSLALLTAFAAENPRVRVIDFSRNFGHEAAMIAGIDYARGDGVVCMDADLQHPPALLARILEKLEAGCEVVNMARTANADAGIVKRFCSALFYRVLNMLSSVKFESNASDFFAVSASVADIMRREYREKARFLRGFIQDVGFQKATIPFVAEKRAAGKSKYSLRKLLTLSANALISFSDLPLRLGIFMGIAAAGVGLLVMIYTIVTKILYNAPSGYATIIVVMCFMFALLFCLLGVTGGYIAVLYKEVKGRPIYIVRRAFNLRESPAEGGRNADAR